MAAWTKIEEDAELDIARRRERQRDWESSYRTREKRGILRSDTRWPTRQVEGTLYRRARQTETCVAPRDVDTSRDFYFVFPEPAALGGGEGGGCQTFSFCSLFPVQQTTSGIGHRVK